MTPSRFKKIILDYYQTNGRHDLPWRKTRDPYKILVSEIMLQQTQVSRVLIKYKSFLKKFPTVTTLAHAPLRNVLSEWQGLGYNRRGMYLKQCAEKIVALKDVVGFGGVWPKDFKTLCSLPGIGPATAGDIMAFAWNIPVTVIETNIRSVYIHFFFPENTADTSIKVSDADIVPLIEKTLDQENPREWYWALFDYGAHLKATRANPSRRSQHHVKQSRFEGSHRQKRAHILKLIIEKSRTKTALEKSTQYQSETVTEILAALEKEMLIKKVRGVYMIY